MIIHAHPGRETGKLETGNWETAPDGRRGPYLPIDAVGAVLAPELREVLQAVPPVLAAPRIELLVCILARLKQVQVLLNPCTRPSSRTELLMQQSQVSSVRTLQRPVAGTVRTITV